MTGFRLGAKAQAAGFRLIGHERVGSTNTEAMQTARDGEADRLWVAALEQTSGRGRRGRAWSSQYGNLAASLYLALPETVTEPGLLGFVAGVSLARAIETLLADAGNRTEIKLKWPNDVLANGGKLVGILLEAEKLPDGRLAVVVGMGVNVAAVPDGVPYTASSLTGLGLDVSAEEVFTALSDSFAETLTLWDNGAGSADVMARWKLQAAGIGGQIGVQMDQRTLEGRFETVDEQGRLIVRTPDGALERVTAGDVYFGSARSLKNENEVGNSG